MKVKEIIIHPGWSSSGIKYDHDIAILKMSDNVKFSQFIQPICLMSFNRTIKNGKVAGWGAIDDYGNTASFAQIANLEFIEPLECLVQNSMLARLAWENSFCAVGRDVGVCQGDSGSGFYVEIENRFYIKGVVSSSLESKSCSQKPVALYSDVTKYYSFIKVRNHLENKVYLC